jgi:protein-S-isoprenylcysteine O-methyltransferase Ste14
MRFFVKQVISLILPVSVLILIPLWIEKNIIPENIPALITGLVIICLGLGLMIVCISLFIRIGKGTLAPWTPTRKFVIAGPYRYVRNPMIIGVLIVLIGESVAILSFNILIWSIAFFIINNIYFTLYEEPNLIRKFGQEYQDYKSKVHRWVPQLKPFNTDRN